MNNPTDLIETLVDVLRGIFEFHWGIKDVIKYIVIIMIICGIGYWIMYIAGGSDLVEQFDNLKGGQIVK